MPLLDMDGNKLVHPFKVESDGTLGGTKVINTKTGKLVGRVQKVVWSMDINDGISRCDLTILGMPIDAQATVANLTYTNDTNPSVESIVRQTVREMLKDEKVKGKTLEQINEELDAEFIEHARSIAKQEEEKSSQPQGE